MTTMFRSLVVVSALFAALATADTSRGFLRRLDGEAGTPPGFEDSGDELVGASFCTYAPDLECYPSSAGWPACCMEESCDGLGEAPPCEDPIQEELDGASFCTYAPDLECYPSSEGWPACCMDDSCDGLGEAPPCQEADGDAVACTLELQICPDGSSVGRTGPDCDFEPCPTANTTIVDVAMAAGSFNVLVELVAAAGLVETLQGPGPFTVFAPTDEAFPAGEALDEFVNATSREDLVAILTYHVVAGQIRSTDLVDGAMVPTVQGQNLTISLADGPMVNDANIISADILAGNGVIHVIDKILMPVAEPMAEPELVDEASGDIELIEDSGDRR